MMLRTIITLAPAAIVLALAAVLLDAMLAEHATDSRCDNECFAAGYDRGEHTAEGCVCSSVFGDAPPATPAERDSSSLGGGR